MRNVANKSVIKTRHLITDVNESDILVEMGHSNRAMMIDRILNGLTIIFFALIFYFVFIPLRLTNVASRKDPLELKWQSEGSYWHVKINREFDRGRYLKQY